MLITTISAGLLTSAAVMVTLHRTIGTRKMVKHATAIDICFSVLLFWSFSGTVTGILTAVIAGLSMAIMLTIMKKSIEATDKLADTLGGLKSEPSQASCYAQAKANKAPRSTGRKPFAIKL